MKDEYLWEGTGPADPEVARLERLLGRYRHRPEPLGAADAVPRRPARRALRLAGALAAAAAVVVLFGPGRGESEQTYAVHGPGGASLLRSGERIVADGPVQLDVGDIGSLLLDPGARLLVDAPRGAEHGFFLERGTAHAQILAEPRVFQIGTPAGISVDLGCVYSLTVTDDDRSELSVSSGRVAFETEGRAVVVPQGAACAAVPGVGPNAPVFGDARGPFRAAVRAVEESAAPDPELVARVRDDARPRDSLTLWHLAQNAATPAVRQAAYDGLVRIAGRAPEGGEGLVAGDERAARAWRDAVEWTWF